MKVDSAIVKPVLLAALALTLLMLPGVKLPYLDQKADAYFSETIMKAGVAYSVCRVVNASVSVIKESEVQIEPAGLGVSLAAGQVLDPLDDMTERASDVLVTAIVSLGILKIAYELSVEFALALIAIFLITFVAAALFKGNKAKITREIVLKSIIFIAVARLCLPISALVSTYLNDHYFKAEINKAKDELAMNSPQTERLKNMRMPQIDGVFGTVKNGFNFVEKKTSDLGAALKGMIRNAERMMSNLLTLSYLYVALFIIQCILLPIGAFWLLTQITNALCGTHLPHIIRHKDVMNRARGENQTDDLQAY